MAEKVHFSHSCEDRQIFEFLCKKNENTNSDLYRRAVKALSNVVENGLTTRQKQVIMLYYFKRLNMPEIAKLLGLDKSTVSRTIKRARDKIFSVLRYYFNQ